VTKAVAPLVTISRVLERWHGPPPAPFPTRPFEIILFENVAYLASDVRRRRAFDALATSIGTTPQEILAAPPEKLWRVTEHGILPDQFAAKLALAAEIALSECDGDLDAVVRKPVAEAKRTLRKFPGIGEPGAEKILLFTGRHAFLAPDSNALRVLVRLGVVTERKNYAATYKAAREVAERQLGDDVDAHLAAHQLLRRHGQEICKRSSPACERCPLNDRCRFGR
jgi:endonuclease III